MRALFWVKSSFLPSMIVKSLVCVFVFLSVTSAQPAQALFKVDSMQTMSLSSWLCTIGDSVAWSKPTYDDSHWLLTDMYSLPLDERGIFWLRKTVRLERSSGNDNLVLRISLLQSAYEVYWDGIQVGGNGTVGVGEEREIPGTLHYAVPLSFEEGHDGLHVLSFRCSSVHASAPARTCSSQIREGIIRA